MTCDNFKMLKKPKQDMGKDRNKIYEQNENIDKRNYEMEPKRNSEAEKYDN